MYTLAKYQHTAGVLQFVYMSYSRVLVCEGERSPSIEQTHGHQHSVYMSYSKLEEERGTEREIDSLGLTEFLSHCRVDVYTEI